MSNSLYPLRDRVKVRGTPNNLAMLYSRRRLLQMGGTAAASSSSRRPTCAPSIHGGRWRL